MLSTSSFNALLKTLEEPPPYVKFLLATTDPQKLPATVLSRCLQFSLKNMPPEPIVGHLQNVLTSENIPFEDDALWLLGRAADGSMRDAMSLTDQAVSFGDGSVMAEDVRAMLGTLDQGQIYGVLKALIAGDARGALSAVAHLAEHGPDWAGVLAEILNALHRIAIAQLMPDAIDNGQGDREQVLELAAMVPAEDVQFYYQLGLMGRRDLPLAPDPRDGFEMVLLRMLAFRPANLPGSAPSTPLLQPELADTAGKTDAEQQAAPLDSAASPVPVTRSNTAPVATEPAHASAPAAIAQSATASAAEVVAPWEEAAVTEVEPKSASAPVIVQQPAALLTPPSAQASGQSSAPSVASAAASQVAAVVEPVSAPAVPSVVAPLASPETASASGEQPPPDYDQDYGQAFAAEDDDEEAYLDHSNFQDYADLSGVSSHDATATPQSNNAGVDLQPHIAPASGLAAEWQVLFSHLNLGGMTANIAANTVLVEKNLDTWLLHLDPNHSALFNPTQQQRINDAINAQLDAPITLQIEQQVPTQETPALALLRQQAKRQQEAEEAIYADPIVLQLIDTFGAKIVSDSIEPLESAI